MPSFLYQKNGAIVMAIVIAQQIEMGISDRKIKSIIRLSKFPVTMINQKIQVANKVDFIIFVGTFIILLFV